jgi:malate dehydrogenase (oxaloacetate-decarboxylating)
LAFAWGLDPAHAIVVDSRGILGKHRGDLFIHRHEFVDKWSLCGLTNAEERRGGIPEALVGADVVVALSRPVPGTIRPEWIKTMAKDAIVFACANPLPEIWPWEAQAAGAAIVATGRSDFPNQVNNSLGFPGIFRGALDVRASTITDAMCFAAAEALAGQTGNQLGPDQILPTMDDWQVFAHEAAAVGRQAVEQGVARLDLSHKELFEHATQMIERCHNLTRMMMDKTFIAPCPLDRDILAE